MSDKRKVRQRAGFLKARLPELRLQDVHDNRSRQGRRWKLPVLLRSVLLGLMSGCKNLREIETLTEEMARPLRHLFKIKHRVPDTTLHDMLQTVDVNDLEFTLQRLVHGADRRKALIQVDTSMPIRQLAMDGKSITQRSWDGEYAQRVRNKETHHVYGHVRTFTGTLVGCHGRPCIFIRSIPAKTNEDGGFTQAFEDVLTSVGGLFDLVSYDAGATSRKNAHLIVSTGKHYLMRVNLKQKKMYGMMQELLNDDDQKACGLSEDGKEGSLTLRRLYKASINRFEMQKRFKKRACFWPHTKTIVRIDTVRQKNGREEVLEKRYFCSSLKADDVTATQWLALVRNHWGVEVNHNILDVALGEDDHPLFRESPQAAYAVMVLRRIAYTLLTLFRSVTLRAEENRAVPWRTLLRWLSETLRYADEETLSHLRERRGINAAFI